MNGLFRAVLSTLLVMPTTGSGSTGEIVDQFHEGDRLGVARWSESTTIQLDSVSRIDLTGYYPQYAIALAAGSNNSVHVFASASQHSDELSSASSVIEHVVVRTHGQTALPPVQAVERPIRFVTAHSGRDGRVYLLWAEEESYHPNPHPTRLYLNEWTGTAWIGSERVSDRKARPGIHSRGHLELLDVSGSLRACWIDWRENHFWRALFNAGEGDFPKVYCSHRSEHTWGAAQRVQGRGRFWVHSLSAIEDKAQTAHLFWEERRRPNSARGYSVVRHAVHSEGEWSEQITIAGHRSYDDTPARILKVAVANGPANSILLAWISSRWLSESQEEDILEVRRYVAGHWSEGTVVLSHRAKDVRWASGPDGTAGILFQEYPENRDGIGHDLLFLSVENLSAESKSLLASDTVPGLFDSVVTSDRTTHLVYVKVDTEMGTSLNYRRGVPSPDVKIVSQLQAKH